MADAGIFIGWGPPVRGREAKSLEVFNESVQYWGQLQQDGKIESFEVALLSPHGGDLGGFALLRGTQEGLDEVRNSDEFARTLARAGLIIEGLGVVGAVLGEQLGTQMGIYQEQIAELT
jgi:hypothetical protein